MWSEFRRFVFIALACIALQNCQLAVAADSPKSDAVDIAPALPAAPMSTTAPQLLTGDDYFDLLFYGPAKSKSTPAAKRLLREGRDLYNQGKLLESYKAFKKLTVMAVPSEVDATTQAMALCGLADCYVKQGSIKEADQLVQHAASMLATHSDAWLVTCALARFYAGQERNEEAKTQLRKLATDFSRPSFEDFFIGTMEAKSGQYDTARSRFGEVQLHHSSADGLYFVAALNGAYCEFKQDKNRQAQETLELATARVKDANSGLQANYLPKLLRGRAFLLREMGSITSAKKLEGEALAADLIKVDAGDEHSAANAWQEAYMKKLEKRIKSKWKAPDNIQDEKIVVTFKVAQDGSVSDVVVVDSDASDKAKGAALKALTDAAPLPVFSGPDPSLHIQFTFAKTIRYNAGGSGGSWQPFGR